MGAGAVAAVAAFPVGEAVRIVAGRPPVVLFGDQALIALGARRAGRFDQLLGPYSRDGFHHPGPAQFYLLAPFVRLFAGSGTGLYLGAVILNLVVLAATVGLVWRFRGPLAALWTAVVLDAFALCLGVTTLRQPWNPYLIVLPMILWMLLWAAGSGGSRACGWWALVVGSFIVESEIAVAPTVVVLSLVMVASLLVRRHASGRVWTAAGAGFLALIWVPSIVELFADQPNNAQLTWDSLVANHGVGGSSGMAIAGDALSVMPFGNRDYTLALHHPVWEVAACLLIVAVSALAAMRSARRPADFGPLLVVTGAALVAVLGTLSLVIGPRPVYLYFAIWLTAVVPVALIGLCLAFCPAGRPAWSIEGRPVVDHTVQDRSVENRPMKDHAVENRSVGDLTVEHGSVGVLSVGPGIGRAMATRLGATARSGAWVGPASVVLAVALAGWTVAADLALPTVHHTIGSGPWPLNDSGSPAARARAVADTAVLDRSALSVLGRGDRQVSITVGSLGLWPLAAGVVLRLDERHVASTVTPAAMSLYFAGEGHPTAGASVAYGMFAAADHSALAGFGGTVLTGIDGTVLVYRRS